jgi:hypothetical protein
MAPMLGEIVKLGKNTDGAIIPSSYFLEAAIFEAYKQFTKPYPHGIQVAPFGWEKGHLIKDEAIRTFLDKHEKNTVLYISFG